MKKLLFPEDLLMAGDVTPRTEICRPDNLPSSAPHPPYALNTEVRRAAFFLQLIVQPPSAPPKSCEAREGLAACGILSHWGAQLILTSRSGGARIAVPISQMKTPMLRAAQSLAQHCTTSKGQSWGWSPSFLTLSFSGFFQSSPAVSEGVKEETGTELLATGCCMAWQGLRPGVSGVVQ